MDIVMKQVPTPALGPEGQFWAHLREGRLMVQRSRSSGEFVFYPRLIAPRSGADDLEFVEVSGGGTIYSSTTIRRPAKHGGDYNVCVIDMDEGFRMLSRIVDCAPDAVRISMRVQAVIEKVDFGLHANCEQPVIVFRVVTDGAGQ
jgi:uncharacterized OB-fold protein